MHKSNSLENREYNILGIKLAEIIREYNFTLEHKPVDENDKPLILDSACSTTIKFIGIPIFKATDNNLHDYDEDKIPQKQEKIKIEIKPLLKKSIIIITAIILLLLTFFAGVYFANTEWFNDIFYIESRQMQDLSIKSLKPYDKAYYNSDSQYDMNITSEARYEHYHEYYENVVEKIKNAEFWNETDKKVVLDYINGYEKRKENMENIMFPCKDNPADDECSYGTALSSFHPNAMKEFDRQELLTYRMILSYMYGSFTKGTINKIFSE